VVGLFLLSLKELKDRRPQSRTEKVFTAKQKERLLESEKQTQSLKSSGSSPFMGSPFPPLLCLGGWVGFGAEGLVGNWLGESVKVASSRTVP
jgi:hypothetical protein